MPASVARAIYLTDIIINAKCCYVSIFWSYRIWITLPIAPKPCFTLVCLNAPCHFTPLLNIRPLIFGLTLFGWFISIYLSLSYRNIIFDLRSLFQEHDYGVKQKPFLMSILTGFSYVSQSPLPSAEVKNKWSYTSTPPICLHGVDRSNFTFCLFNAFPIVSACECEK